MPYAINGSSIRAIDNESDLVSGETYLADIPPNWVPEQSGAEKLILFKSAVQEALDKSDLVALRAFKAGVPFGDEWSKYDSDLRALLSVTEWSDDLVLPTKPGTYPS